jgi:hypothetical protein
MLGRWNERSAKLLPVGPYDLVGRPYRAYSVMKGGKVVGSMRRSSEGWMVNLLGFKFNTIPGQGAARFGLKETEVKLFKTAPEARAAIKEAFQLLQEVA